MLGGCHSYCSTHYKLQKTIGVQKTTENYNAIDTNLYQQIVGSLMYAII